MTDRQEELLLPYLSDYGGELLLMAAVVFFLGHLRYSYVSQNPSRILGRFLSSTQVSNLSTGLKGSAGIALKLAKLFAVAAVLWYLWKFIQG